MVYQGESTWSFPDRDLISSVTFLATANFLSSADIVEQKLRLEVGVLNLRFRFPVDGLCGGCGEGNAIGMNLPRGLETCRWKRRILRFAYLHI